MKRRHFLLGAFGTLAAANGASARSGIAAAPASAADAADSRILLAQAGGAPAAPAAALNLPQLPLFNMQGRVAGPGRALNSKLADLISVKDFGALGDGVTDDTAAVQRAIDAFPQGRATIIFPVGVYRLTSTINITQDRINLVGDGKQVSIIRFEPKSEAVCLQFGRGKEELFQAGVKGFGFAGPTNVRKIAIRATDTSQFTVEDVVTYPWAGAGSIGVQLRGRELTRVKNVSLTADLPVSIEDNPNSTLDCDHAHFTDCYFLPGKTQPCIKVESGIHLTNVTFDGAQAWVGGAGGFYWNDTTSTGTSLDVSFSNVRYEQGADPNAYVFFIRHNYAMQGLTIRNAHLSPDTRGIYMRNCKRVMLETVTYHGNKLEAVNMDGSCDEIFFQNSFFQNGSTASMAGLTEKWSLHRFSSRTPIAGTSFWAAGK